MPGTVVRDANATNLLTGATLNAAGTTTSTAVELGWPGDVQFVFTSGTVTGTSPTATIEIQGCETSDFSTADVVTLGTVSNANASNATYAVTTYCDSRYVRCSVVLGGTSPVYTGSTLYAVPPHDRRVRDSAGGGIGFPTSEAIV